MRGLRSWDRRLMEALGRGPVAELLGTAAMATDTLHHAVYAGPVALRTTTCNT